MFDFVWFLGLILLLALHEIGHALSGSMIGRKVTYTIYNGNPSTKITGEALMKKDEFIFVASSGFLLTLLSVSIMYPLFDYNPFFYLACSSVLAINDFTQIYKKLNIHLKEYEQE